MIENYQYPELFLRFPVLRKNLAWISLGNFPTPVKQLKGVGNGNLWVKQDGISSPLYGGNKIRKLEFILAEVEKRKANHVVTFGGIGTNHGLATAIFCNRLNIGCTLLLFRQPVTDYVRNNLLLFHRYGAELVYCKSLFHCALSWYTSQRIRHPGAYFLFAGGSNPCGTVGFVNAAFELKAQIEQGILPEPSVIFCPAGSNGTLAGLSLGAAMAGLKSKVMGVQVSVSHVGPFPACTKGETRKLMHATYRYMKERDPDLPKINIESPTLLGDYLGEGYGYPTDAGDDARKEMKKAADIDLDPTYTAKTFAAVLDYSDTHGFRNQPILYWHTYNAIDLSMQVKNQDYRHLPPSLQTFFKEENRAEKRMPRRAQITAGMEAPDFSFTSPLRGDLRFYDFLGSGGVLLIFLRYMGCPLCQMKIDGFISSQALLEERELNLLIVLQSPPESVQAFYGETGIPFTFVCDPDEKIYQLYGVEPGSIFQYLTPGVIKKALKAKKKGYRHGKKEGREMQLPALFLVDPDGKVEYAFYGRHVGDVPDHAGLFDIIDRRR
jgi:D-cysteine desulfhydrase